jgi:SRSO17 transposase
VSRHGHAFIDRALYLPKVWTDAPDRLQAAHVPEEVDFATKPRIARRLSARALAAQVPFSCVAADSVYGTGAIETMLRKAGQGYVLGVAANQVCRAWGKPQLVEGPPPRARKPCRSTSGGGCRRAQELRDHACMTGPISNWPSSMSANTIAPSAESGRGAC